MLAFSPLAAWGLAPLGSQVSGQVGRQQADDGAAAADALVLELSLGANERSDAYQDRGAILRAGFEAFTDRIAQTDGPRAVELARGLFREDPAIWSAFCLEGALRRADGVSDQAFREASAALDAVAAANAADANATLAIVQRRAILCAGFGRPVEERAALGAALARGGIDGAQITGLAKLQAGDHAAAAALFGSLLDRWPGPDGDQEPARDESVTNARVPKNSSPWALRGHALATLELLRSE